MRRYARPSVRTQSPEQVAETIERARVWVKLLARVVELRAEGLTAAQTAERLGVSVRAVKYWRRIARVSDGRAWRSGDTECKRMGRTREMR